MSLVETTLAAACRAFLIAGAAALCAAWSLVRLRNVPAWLRGGLVTVAALAFFAPSMLAGYGWLPTVTRWPAGSLARETLYCVAIFIRLVPIAVLALWLAKPGPGASALCAWKLAGGRGWKFRVREAGPAPWLAAGAVFLLAFQEFDLATSWGIRTWTVGLFDAQIGGLAIAESLWLAALPFAVELAVIVPLWLTARGNLRSHREAHGDVRKRESAFALAYIAAAAGLFLLYPGVANFHLGADGVRAWLESPAMVREIANAFISGGGAAVLAWVISGLPSKSIRAALAAVGLLGALMLGLLVLALVQFAPAIMSSVAPWLSTLTFALLPYALLLRMMIESGTQRAALHVARTSGARGIEWELWRERSIAAGLLLFCLGYSDFTVATLLAPPQFPTIFPRVFNLMHYGQSAVLSFTVFTAIVAPVVCAALTLLLVRLYVRRRVR